LKRAAGVRLRVHFGSPFNDQSSGFDAFGGMCLRTHSTYPPTRVVNHPDYGHRRLAVSET